MTGKLQALCGVKALALVAGLLAGPVYAQERISVNAGQGRALAVNTLQAGNPRDAVVLANAVLGLVPNDPSMLLVITEAAIQLRDYPSAVEYGQRAFWNAANNGQRFSAARLTALGHVQQEQFNRAQFWLRLARQNAPTEAAAEVIAKDFQAVRRQNPWTVNLRFGVTPSTNVNGGTFNETVPLFFAGETRDFVLSPDARALSGWEIFGSTSLRYKARTDATSATFLDFSLSGTTYRLTEGSQDRLDEFTDSSNKARITGQSFSSASLSFGITHRFVLTPDANVTEASLSFARNFQKDEDEKNTLSASLSHTFTLSDTASLSVSGVSARKFTVVGDDETQSYRGQVTYGQSFENIGVLRFTLGAEHATSTDTEDEFDSKTVSVSFSPDFDIDGTTFTFLGQRKTTEWDFHNNFDRARDDTNDLFRVTAVLGGVEVFGFNPVVTLEREVQESSSLRFDRKTTSFGVDFVSSF